MKNYRLLAVFAVLAMLFSLSSCEKRGLIIDPVDYHEQVLRVSGEYALKYQSQFIETRIKSDDTQEYFCSLYLEPYDSKPDIQPDVELVFDKTSVGIFIKNVPGYGEALYVKNDENISYPDFLSKLSFFSYDLEEYDNYLHFSAKASGQIRDGKYLDFDFDILIH